MLKVTVFNNIVQDIAKKYCIDAALIHNKLLSNEDKDDFHAGNLPLSALDLHVKVWIEKGMPDYAHGELCVLAEKVEVEVEVEESKPSQEIQEEIFPEKSKTWNYRKPFVAPR